MRFLVDTNFLLRSVDPKHPLRHIAKRATRTLSKQGANLYIVPQNITEFWNVYTRPVERNGMGHTAVKAQREIKRLKRLFSLLEDTPGIHREWERLVNTYGIKGVKVYDARLVAAMLVHKLTNILTFDDRDFNHYEGITVVHPSQVLSKSLFKGKLF